MLVWQAGQESNLQPADLEAAALPIELRASTTRLAVPAGDYHMPAARPTTRRVVSLPFSAIRIPLLITETAA